MNLVSPLLKHVLYPCLSGTGYLRAPSRKIDTCIVTYHGLLPEGYKSVDPELDGALVTADAFGRQLHLLKTHYHVLSPAEFLSWCRTNDPFPPRSVLVTCDDGLLNALTDMLPILQAEQVSCLFFVTGASLADSPEMLWYEELYLMLRATRDSRAHGNASLFLPPVSNHLQDWRSLWWSLVKSLSQYAPDARKQFLKNAAARLGLPEDWKLHRIEDTINQKRFLALTISQLREILAAGMSIGAHTSHHPILSQMPAPLAWSEISENRHALEKALGTTVWALAYPFGHSCSVSEREIEMAKRAGYQCAFLNVEDTFAGRASLFALPRVHVTGNMSLSEFEAHISGFHHSLRSRFADIPSITLRS